MDNKFIRADDVARELCVSKPYAYELYAKYKTAPTEEEREQARQEYLDRRGVPKSFRW